MLILISKIKKQLLWLWVGFSTPVVLLIFIQTIAGKYQEIEWIPWIWLGINLFPGFLLLMIGAIRNLYAGKFIQNFIYRIIFISTLAYLLLIVLTLFSMTAGAAHQSLADYFSQSYQWLVPFQLILLAVFGLMYFRQQAVFQPNEKIIKGHVEKRARLAAEQNNLYRQQAYEWLVNRDYSKLFVQLRSFFEADPKSIKNHDQTIMLQSQYNDWKKQTDLGLIEHKDAQLTINRITMALINLIEKL